MPYIDAVAEHFGNFVRWRRAKLGMNKRKFAEKLGVDPKTVTNLERRATVIGTDDVTVARISEVLEVPLEQIMADGANGEPTDLSAAVMRQLKTRARDTGLTIEEFVRAAMLALDVLPQAKRDALVLRVTKVHKPGVFPTLAATETGRPKGK